MSIPGYFHSFSEEGFYLSIDDEFFEALTLIQNRKILNFPVVLVGKDYGKPLVELLEQMGENRMIDPADLTLLTFTDSIEEALAHIEQYAVDEFQTPENKAYQAFPPIRRVRQRNSFYPDVPCSDALKHLNRLQVFR